MITYLIEKEFRQFFRNAFLPRLVLFMPFMMVLVLPWAANQEVTDLQLCVVDHDGSQTTSRMINKVTAGKYFALASTAPTYEEALQNVEEGRADLVLEIPRHFERDLERGSCPVIFIAADAVNGTKGTMGAAYLSQIVNAFGGNLMDKSAAVVSEHGSPVLVSLCYRYNPNLDYKVYMVPAMMVMLLTLLTGFLPALNIVSEKEMGTIEQINVSPVGKFQFIISKLLPYWAIGLTIMTLCLFLAWLVYGLIPEGSLLTIYIFAGIYILVMSGFGLVISNHSANMQQAVFVMYFFMMILLLMSGLFTPVGSMPEWAQWIAAFNPLKYFVSVMRSVFLKGSVLADLLPNLYALSAFAVALNAWSILSYRKRG